MYSDLMKTKYQLILDELEDLDRSLVYRDDDYGVYQVKPAYKVKAAYYEILNNLDDIPDLSENEKIELKNLIELKIAEIPARDKEEREKFELESEKELQETRERRTRAFNEALERWEKLSIWEKMKYKRRYRAPKNIDIHWTSTEEIDSLYRNNKGGKDDR